MQFSDRYFLISCRKKITDQNFNFATRCLQNEGSHFSAPNFAYLDDSFSIARKFYDTFLMAKNLKAGLSQRVFDPSGRRSGGLTPNWIRTTCPISIILLIAVCS